MAYANRNQRLLGKPIYLIVTHLGITYAFSEISQFMQEPCMVHWEGALRVLAYIKHAPHEGLKYRCHDHLRIEIYSNGEYSGTKEIKNLL